MEVCTIIAKNYIAPARVLASSLADQHPGSRLWTLVIDDFEGYLDPAQEPFELLTPADIGCESFNFMALRYSVLELSTAVKPWLLRHLMGETGRPVTYLDPDIRIYGSLQRLDELASEHGVVLIPHNSHPIPPDGRKPSQVDVMIAGVYNLGYLSLAPRAEVARLLDWWADRLRRDCRVDPTWGYFVDQRWFDLVPGFLNECAIVRDPEYNVAYWNLHSRELAYDGRRYLVDGRPLAFFHFSGFDATQPLSLSRYQNRIDVAANPPLERLLRNYAREVLDAGYAVSRHWPYGYRALGDGTEITEIVRSFCDEFEEEQERQGKAHESVFTPTGARTFMAWLGEDASGVAGGVPRILARLYEQRADLQREFPDLGGADRGRFMAWAAEAGRKEYPLLDKVLAEGVGGRSARQEGDAHRRPFKRLVKLPEGPWGVNVAGHFHSSSEIGEAARQLVSAFDQHGIPAAPVQSWSTPLIEEGQPYATISPESAPYIINVICSQPNTLGNFAKEVGERFFAGRYSIGLAFCDRPVSGEELSFVQELWVPSRYAAAAVASTCPVPVFAMPLSVEPGVVAEGTRQRLGLADDKLVFAATLELGEELERRNPVGVVEAFARAFAESDPAQLVIGVHKGHRGEALEALRKATGGRKGVRLLEGLASRREALELIAACDCYVSLHRAEPFGMTIAQAMWLGRPVIATRHSGNLDFMNDSNGLLVDCGACASEVSGVSGDAAGSWAEPEIDHAASLMRQVVADPARARALGAQAAADMARRHSAQAAIDAIKHRLEAIRSTGQVPAAVTLPKRSPVLNEAFGLVNSGPPRGPRGGSYMRVRGAIRKAVLRALRPYTDYQRRVNVALLDAIAEKENVVSVEQAQLLAELRGARQLREAVEAQGRGLDELSRRLRLASDRSLYLALGELARRHSRVSEEPGEVPEALGLEAFELRGYSQNGEDGVLAEILRRIGVANRYFVEFGVEGGSEGNCVYLADVAGWDGLFMEADERFYRLLDQKYAPRSGVKTLHVKVTPENVDGVLRHAGVPTRPDVMSIDVDGADYWIWEALTEHHPRVVVIEYNSALDPQRRLVQPREQETWDGTEYFGASLGAMSALGERKGYRLVHTELSGANAFFVADELAEGRFLEPGRVLLRGAPNYYQSGQRHPADERARPYVDLETGQMVRLETGR